LTTKLTQPLSHREVPKSLWLSTRARCCHAPSVTRRKSDTNGNCRHNRIHRVPCSKTVRGANLRLAIPTLPYGRNRDLLMPVSIFKEPSPASSAGAWLLSALESGFLQPPASCLEPPEQQKTRRQAPGCSAPIPNVRESGHSSKLGAYSSLCPTELRVESSHS